MNELFTRPRAIRHLLLACSLPCLLVGVPAQAAFNPNTGNTTLPDPSQIYGQPATTPGYISPLAPVQMPPSAPLYPSLADGAQPVAVTQPLAAGPSMTPTDSGFIAPAPLVADSTAKPNFPLPAFPSDVPAKPEDLASIPASPAPIALTPPPAPLPPAVVAMPIPAPLQIQQAAIETQKVAQVPPAGVAPLDPQTRIILSHIPGHIDQPKPSKSARLDMQRTSPDVKELAAKPQEETYQATGISIKVSRPGLDENFELNRAYTALMGNDTDTAIETYKNILSSNPKSQDALFGLAATYHRLGNTDKARALYGALLQINPNHREGLNNFLVLVSEESPQDALPELERLETRNPHFSPIPAQIAVVLDKMGYAQEARDKMMHAIELSPENLTYKYNLAVMLDRQGQATDATALYSMLIESSLHGEKVPASVNAMQKRVNYLTAKKNPAAAPTTVSDASGSVN